MLPRLRIQRREVSGRHVFRLEGELDGSTACLALDSVGRVPGDGRGLEVDLSAVRLIGMFGLEILSRGLGRLAHEREVYIVDTSRRWPNGAVLVPGTMPGA
jgi:anti-anti-sigma regulatory factor